MRPPKMYAREAFLTALKLFPQSEPKAAPLKVSKAPPNAKTFRNTNLSLKV